MTAETGRVPGGTPGDGNGDEDDRRRISHDLDRSVVVVAGAGTGKTTCLVDRLLRVLEQGTPLRQVAVISFTEAAAAELRTRVRQALADRPSNPLIDAALDEVDEAAICTLHAFAQRMLVEHGIAVGLPPGFEVLDEVAQVAEFEDRWNRFADALLDDPGAESGLIRAFALGLLPRDLATVAFELYTNWDHLDDGALVDLLGCEDGTAEPLVPVQATAVIGALDRVLGCASWCTDPSDLLLDHLRGTLTSARDRLVEAGDDDEPAVLAILRSPGRYSSRLGRQENWGDRIGKVRELCDHAEEVRMSVLEAARRSVVDGLLAHLARFAVASAAQRRRKGRITFHDLLVLARSLVRHDARARESLRRRYSHILIDEFQDTDPIQVELAAWLTSRTGGARDLADTRPGSLFVVGDPKQAIYRFRRADIELFDHAVDQIGDTVGLRTNFRSVPGIVAYVNAVFATLLGEGAPGQARHGDLLAHREPLAEPPAPAAGPSKTVATPTQLAFALGDRPARKDPAGPAPVLVVGGRLEMAAAEVRRAAGRDAAAALVTMVESAWVVSDPRDGTVRPVRWGDIAVLMPTRASLPPLSEAFDELDVPYRLEGGALLWGCDEVRDVLTVLRAADDPANALAVVGALRSPGLACGDDDLVVWHQAGGSWDPRSPVPAGLGDHPVARAMAVVMDLHRARWRAEPSAMVRDALTATHAFELALAHRRPRDFWHRLRWLLDQARRFDETSAGTLRSFLHWAALHEEADDRSEGVGPPDPDDDAVRVMTVHGAKGLEFPVVVVTGLDRDGFGGHRDPKVVWVPDHDEPGFPRRGAFEVSFGKDIATPGHADALAREHELDAMEQVRLLYVAMTRARDHLVVCLHHGSTRSGLSEHSHGSLLTELGARIRHLWRDMPLPEAGRGGGVGGVTGDVAGSPGRPRRPDHPRGHGHGTDEPSSGQEWETRTARWESERSTRLVGLRRRPLATATAIAEAFGSHRPASPDPGQPDAAHAPRRGADEALLVGRAVHGALAAVDLATGLDAAGRRAPEVARDRARALGIEGPADEVAGMVGRALRSEIVRRAARTKHHKELYVAMVLDDGEGGPGRGGVFEGFVDLLLDEPEGMVVVDYKTDRLSGTASDATLGRHRLQVAAYADALQAATGRPVSRCVLLFLAGDEVVEDVLLGDELDRVRAVAASLAAQVAGRVPAPVSVSS